MITEEDRIAIRLILGKRAVTKILDYFEVHKIKTVNGKAHTLQSLSPIWKGKVENVSVEAHIVTCAEEQLKKNEALRIRKSNLKRLLT